MELAKRSFAATQQTPAKFFADVRNRLWDLRYSIICGCVAIFLLFFAVNHAALSDEQFSNGIKTIDSNASVTHERWM